MKSQRFRIAAVAFGAALLLSVGSAAGSPPSGSDGDGRIALNGTRLTGLHSAARAGDDGSGGRIAVNGTAITGIRPKLLSHS